MIHKSAIETGAVTAVEYGSLGSVGMQTKLRRAT